MKFFIAIVILLLLSGCASDNYYTPASSDYGYCIKTCTGGNTTKFDTCQPKCIGLAEQKMEVDINATD